MEVASSAAPGVGGVFVGVVSFKTTVSASTDGDNDLRLAVSTRVDTDVELVGSKVAALVIVLLGSGLSNRSQIATPRLTINPPPPRIIQGVLRRSLMICSFIVALPSSRWRSLFFLQ